MSGERLYDPSAFPQRRHFAWATALFVLIAVYGSFVPLNYTPISVRDAALRFKDLPLLKIGIESRADWVANILLFMPIGFCAMATVVVDRTPRIARDLLCGFAIWIVCVALSFAIEFTQIWFPPRTTSQNDIQAECLGGAIGIVLARYLAMPMAVWLRRVAPKRQPLSRLVWLLQIYVVGLIIYEMLPLDITIHPREIWAKLKEGRIEIIPFSSWRLDFNTFSGIAYDLLLHIPLGAWCALGPLTSRKRKGDFGFAAIWSIGIVIACEIAQVFVYSRYAATTDVLVCGLGAVFGAWLAIRLNSDAPSHPVAERVTGQRRFWLSWGAFVIAYLALLCVMYWNPFEVVADRELVERRMRNFLSVPFSKLYWGSEFNAITQMLGKLISFMPLGVAWAIAAGRLGIVSRWARFGTVALLVAVVGVFACGIELVQALIPPHFPDVTDAIFYTSGAVAGWFAARFVVGTGSGGPQTR
jgi:glycopeptide antibiotics resistance protein